MVDLTDAPHTHVRDVRERSEPLPEKFSSEANRCRPNFGERSHPLQDEFWGSGYMGLQATCLDQNTCMGLKVDFPKKISPAARCLIGLSFSSVTITLLEDNLKL
jgi:hypothetical protein